MRKILCFCVGLCWNDDAKLQDDIQLSTQVISFDGNGFVAIPRGDGATQRIQLMQMERDNNVCECQLMDQ